MRKKPCDWLGDYEVRKNARDWFVGQGVKEKTIGWRVDLAEDGWRLCQ